MLQPLRNRRWTRRSPVTVDDERPRSATAVRRRVALYSHDTMGLGHTRRNLLLAHSMAAAGLEVDVLLISGAAEISAFDLPPSVDCLALPALHKTADGNYQARRLDLPLRELTAVRAATIEAALDAFAPDVLIVDNVPRGANRELDPALERLRANGRTRCVLGMRDVLDEPAIVAREWERQQTPAALREFYDQIWVYGDPLVYDPVREYRWPEDVAARVRYTGYLDQRRRPGFAGGDSLAAVAALGLPTAAYALCLVGGGQDGARLAEAFAAAPLPDGLSAVLLTGPYLPADARARLEALAATQPRLRVLGFHPEPTLLMERAATAVTMGGYNTVCELLSFQQHGLIVPRVTPRLEQLLRAERLRTLGLVDVLHPGELDPDAISRWLTQAWNKPRPPGPQLDLKGVERVPHLLQSLLEPLSVAPAACLLSAHNVPAGRYVA